VYKFGQNQNFFEFQVSISVWNVQASVSHLNHVSVSQLMASTKQWWIQEFGDPQRFWAKSLKEIGTLEKSKQMCTLHISIWNYS